MPLYEVVMESRIVEEVEAPTEREARMEAMRRNPTWNLLSVEECVEATPAQVASEFAEFLRACHEPPKRRKSKVVLTPKRRK